jgi:hypothetical protein
MFKKIIIVLVAALAVLGCEVQANTKSVDRAHTITLIGAPTGVNFTAYVYATGADIQKATPIGGGAAGSVTTAGISASILVQPYTGSFNASYQIVIEAGGERRHKSDVSLISGGYSTLNWSEMTPITAAASGISLLDGDETIGNYVFAPVNGEGYTNTELPAALSVSIKNTGATETGVLTITLSGDDEDFTVPTTIATIPANETRSNAFTIRPKTGLEEGVHGALVTVGNTANGITASFSVSFKVNNPSTPSFGIELGESGTYSFPDAAIDDSLPSKTVRIINTGNQDTGKLTVILSGTDSASFTLSTTTPATTGASITISNIKTGGTATFEVTPKKDGLTTTKTYTADVTVGPAEDNDNDIDEYEFNRDFTVSLKVVEATYIISLDQGETYDFGSTFADYTSAPEKVVTIYNNGTHSTGDLTVALSGTDNESFTLSTTTTPATPVASIPISSIKTGENAKFKISPALGLELGTYTATVTVGPAEDNTNPIGENNFNKSITVSFEVDDQYPVLVLTGLNGNSKHTFKTAYTDDESTSKEVTVTVTNKGNVPVTNLKFSLGDDPLTVFDIEPTALASLAPKATTSFKVVADGNITDDDTYTDTVLVTGEYGTDASVTSVSFNLRYDVKDPFDSVEEALTYLNNPNTPGGDEDNRVLLKMELSNLADTTADGDGWTALVDRLGASGQTKLVDLDLSLCSLASTAPEFDLNVTGGTTANGKAKIVSLILPAVTVTNTNSSTSSNYSALKEIYGTKRETATNVFATTVIGPSAFKSFTALTKADFPDTTEPIGESAFLGCTSLKEVNFPNVEAIGTSAFAGCIALGGHLPEEPIPTLSFPAATIIGEYAFNGCTNLERVTADLAEEIEEYAFSDCPKLTFVSLANIESIETGAFGRSAPATEDTIKLTIIMTNTTPPDLTPPIFEKVFPSKEVEVKVPSDAVAAYNADTWKPIFAKINTTTTNSSLTNLAILPIQ